MNSNVYEIISQLVRKMLNKEQEITDEERLISTLQEEGYKLEDINQAFEFIFSSSDIIDISKDKEHKQRILDFRERFKFNLNVQGIIIKLNSLDLLSNEELETIITKSVSHHKIRLDVLDFWEILEEIIDDEFRLATLVEKIPEFKIINAGNQEYVH
ncbi:Protein of unknown function (DUF494) [Halobacteroides halobius DSM 5150]|uniref:Smg protein n=1 Tax=Halobacteroides halobius (strain ATCC 35273 / DSM 5150 / MD-1) TaxID=748449 RepID=L0K5Q4_HALHC|nr:DUF494 family protein [Halobacteroides halobius]AGB40617.1 Protein of unknown function (DUF494) [Halobacteroides halobius DSM 5150]